MKRALLVFCVLCAATNCDSATSAPADENVIAYSLEELFSDARHLVLFRPSFAVVTLDATDPPAQWLFVPPDRSLQRTHARMGERVPFAAALPSESSVDLNWYRGGPARLDFDGSYARATPTTGSHYLLAVGPDPWRTGEFAVGYAFALDDQGRLLASVYGFPVGTLASDVMAFVRQQMALLDSDSGAATSEN